MAVEQQRFGLVLVALLMTISTLNVAVAAPAAQEGQDVTVTLPYESFTSFDHAYWTSQLLISQGTIFEGLYGYDEQLNVIPKIAESGTASSDNTVWTFKLRQDKKWANGDPVTAHDFYTSWMRFLSPEIQDTPMWAGFFGQVQGGWAYKAGAAKPEDVGIKLVDDYTLEVTLTQPNAVLPNLLVLASSMPIHSKTLEEHPNDWWHPQYGAYNGPFVVEEWTSGGDTVLTRNPNYVGDVPGNVTTIVLRPYTDPNTLIQAFENGEVQFAFLGDVSQVQYARNNPAMEGNIHEDLNLSWNGIQFDRAANDGPWADARVRKALAMAIDKQAIVDNVLRGLAVPTTAFSGDPKITSEVRPLEYNVAEAQRLLAEAGYPGGEGFPEVTFYAPPANSADMPMIEAIAKMWQDNLGVKVTIQNNESAIYTQIQWANINPNVKPGYTTLGGPMNWFEPIYLLSISDHIWYFMDFTTEWKLKSIEYDQQRQAVDEMTVPGDWAELQRRADAAWAERQAIVAKENNQWGQDLMASPTFKEQFDNIAARFTSATDEAGKLAAYKDGLRLVLDLERSNGEYHGMNESNREARRLLAELTKSTMEEAYQYVIPLQQMAVDSAWMVPVSVNKIIYVTDPKLSGIVLNKLSWGNIFQFQYLRYEA